MSKDFLGKAVVFSNEYKQLLLLKTLIQYVGIDLTAVL